MKLEYYTGKTPNFGDEINSWMWPKLLPNFFNEDDSTVFIGIGSIIGEKSFPKETKKIVFGAGFVPEYHDKPNISDPNWKFYFVRGPRTADLLGLDEELAIGDPAILINQFTKPNDNNADKVISFMPHWESIERGNWEQVCERLGYNFINPCTEDVDFIITEINRSKLLITEAMHGAIVADTLRVPWIPVLPINKAHRNKWSDWARTLDIQLTSYKLLPSDLKEARLSKVRGLILKSPIIKVLKPLFIALASWKLNRISKRKSHLSNIKKSNEVTSKMLAKIEQLREDYS